VRDWWSLISTFLVLAGFTVVAVLGPWWPIRVLGAVGMALTMVRAFILFHDLHHSAIFRDSPLARAILNVYGLLILTPPRIWRETHNYHHAHTAKTDGRHLGTYTLHTTKQWRETTPRERLFYRVERHPLTVLFGYVTVFGISFGLVPFFRNPWRYRDSGLALLLHGGLAAAIFALAGPATFFFAFLLPFLIAGATGAWLFYIQHNFEGLTIPEPKTWDHTRAALEGASYLKLGSVLRWFTGNIGFHHVHHLNPRIPFYRLPAAMDAIPELQNPPTITVGPRTLFASFRLKLWDPDARRLVGYGAARD
jgi:omega-6 fatty acid desaturase (delta-12 desaturase)